MLNAAFIIGGLIAVAIAIWGERFYDADVEGIDSPCVKAQPSARSWKLAARS
jgi:hypothetical protein